MFCLKKKKKHNEHLTEVTRKIIVGAIPALSS